LERHANTIPGCDCQQLAARARQAPLMMHQRPARAQPSEASISAWILFRFP